MAMTGGTAKLVKTGTLNYGNYPATVKLYVYYKSTQDVSNNRSTISCGMYFVVTDGYHIGTWYDSGSYVGTTSNTFTKDVPYTGGTYWLAENKTFTVNHKSDGTGTATIYWKWGVNSPWGQMVTPSGSFTITLPTIARASSVSATNAYIGNQSTITISRKSSSFTHTLQYKIKGQSSYTNISDYIKTTKTSCPWTIPTAAYNYLSSTGKSVTITINCITYNGSTAIGSKTCVITATGKDSALKPDTPTLTPTIVNGFNDIYIKGKSSIKLTSSKPTTSKPITKYGATIKSYIFAGPNINGTSSTYTGTSNSKTSSVIQSYGNKTYSVQVKDSRGMLSDKGTVSITVSDYSAPTIKSMSLSKSENTSNMTITVKVVTTHQKIGSNAITVTMNNIGTISPTVTNSSSTTNNITTTTFTYTYSGVPLTSTGNVTATIHDSVYSSKTISKSVSITPATRVLNIAKNGNGVGIGQMSTVPETAAGKFECAWDSYFNKNIYFNDTAQQVIRFNNASTSGWQVNLYKGTSVDSATVIGVYDVTNNRSVWKYLNDGTFNVYRPLQASLNISTAGVFGSSSSYNEKNFAMYCQWKDGKNHDMIVRNTDGLTMGIGWVGDTNNKTVLDIRPSIASARGELFTNAKTVAYDGKQGVCVSDNGRVYVVGDSSSYNSGIVFAYNKSTKGTSSMIETASGVITVTGTLKATVDGSSDERMKRDFQNLNKFEEFYDDLNPCCFKMKSNDERYHIGFVAQQVEQSLNNNGLTKNDFGALNITPYEGDIDESSEDCVGRYKDTGIRQGDDSYSLAYHEFIALNTHMIQKLKSKNEELKYRVSLLEEKLNSVITEIEKLKESIKNEA